MSMRSSIIAGFGFSPKGADIEKVLRFLKNHADNIPDNKEAQEAVRSLDPDTVHQTLAGNPGIRIDAWLPETCPALAAVLDCFLDDSVSQEYLPCLYKAVADIIQQETSINMEYQSGQEDCIGNEGYIMLAEGMPWNFTQTERSLTRETFAGILAPYVEELGLDPDKEIDWCEVEYYG